MLYASNNHGALPPDLGTLAKVENLSATVFICPSTDTSAPSALTNDQTSDWINANSDYVYVGAGLILQNIPNASGTAICYDKEQNHSGDGINILFADGHVEFQAMDAAQQLIGKIAKPQ
jgi:prepilin-type processing-associated H-X9-DG protein